MAQKDLIVLCISYLVESEALKSIPCSSGFFTALLTYLNRVIIVKPEVFVSLLQETMKIKNFTL